MIFEIAAGVFFGLGALLLVIRFWSVVWRLCLSLLFFVAVGVFMFWLYKTTEHGFAMMLYIWSMFIVATNMNMSDMLDCEWRYLVLALLASCGFFWYFELSSDAIAHFNANQSLSFFGIVLLISTFTSAMAIFLLIAKIISSFILWFRDFDRRKKVYWESESRKK